MNIVKQLSSYIFSFTNQNINEDNKIIDDTIVSPNIQPIEEKTIIPINTSLSKDDKHEFNKEISSEYIEIPYNSTTLSSNTEEFISGSLSNLPINRSPFTPPTVNPNYIITHTESTSIPNVWCVTQDIENITDIYKVKINKFILDKSLTNSLTPGKLTCTRCLEYFNTRQPLMLHQIACFSRVGYNRCEGFLVDSGVVCGKLNCNDVHNTTRTKEQSIKIRKKKIIFI